MIARSWTAVSNKQVEGGLPAFAKAMGSMQGMSHSRKARVDQHCWVASSVAWAACLTPASTGTAVTAQGGAQQLNDLCTLFSGLGMHHLLYATGKRGDAGLRASASPRGHTGTSMDDGDDGGRVEGLWEGPGSGDGLEHHEGAASAAAGAAAVGTAALARDVDAPASDDDMFDGAGEPWEGQRGGDGGEHEEGSDAAAASTPAALLPAAVAAPLTPDDGEEADVSESEEEAVGHLLRAAPTTLSLLFLLQMLECDDLPCHYGGVFQMAGTARYDVVFCVAKVPLHGKACDGVVSLWTCVVATIRVGGPTPGSGSVASPVWCCDACVSGGAPEECCAHVDAILDRFGLDALSRLANDLHVGFMGAPGGDGPVGVPFPAVAPFLGPRAHVAHQRWTGAQPIHMLASQSVRDSSSGEGATVGWDDIVLGWVKPPPLHVAYSEGGDCLRRYVFL